jgi:hypothetical protein
LLRFLPFLPFLPVGKELLPALPARRERDVKGIRKGLLRKKGKGRQEGTEKGCYAEKEFAMQNIFF